jgi:ubiquitin carboxyl-terminal hydrolase 20/33
MLSKQFGEYTDLSSIQPPIEICQECRKKRKELEERRCTEAAAISELDTRQINSERGEQWHLIDTHWLNEFLAFRDGRQRNPPGPITNDRLVIEDGQPRVGLRRGVNYRAVNPQVWDYLFGRYGGGPVIKRNTIDIYGPSNEGSGRRAIDIIIPKRNQYSSDDESSSLGTSSPKRISPRRQPR